MRSPSDQLNTMTKAHQFLVAVREDALKSALTSQNQALEASVTKIPTDDFHHLQNLISHQVRLDSTTTFLLNSFAKNLLANNQKTGNDKIDFAELRISELTNGSFSISYPEYGPDHLETGAEIKMEFSSNAGNFELTTISKTLRIASSQGAEEVTSQVDDLNAKEGIKKGFMQYLLSELTQKDAEEISVLDDNRNLNEATARSLNEFALTENQRKASEFTTDTSGAAQTKPLPIFGNLDLAKPEIQANLISLFTKIATGLAPVLRAKTIQVGNEALLLQGGALKISEITNENFNFILEANGAKIEFSLPRKIFGTGDTKIDANSASKKDEPLKQAITTALSQDSQSFVVSLDQQAKTNQKIKISLRKEAGQDYQPANEPSEVVAALRALNKVFAQQQTGHHMLPRIKIGATRAVSSQSTASPKAAATSKPGISLQSNFPPQHSATAATGVVDNALFLPGAMEPQQITTGGRDQDNFDEESNALASGARTARAAEPATQNGIKASSDPIISAEIGFGTASAGTVERVVTFTPEASATPSPSPAVESDQSASCGSFYKIVTNLIGLLMPGKKGGSNQGNSGDNSRGNNR